MYIFCITDSVINTILFSVSMFERYFSQYWPISVIHILVLSLGLHLITRTFYGNTPISWHDDIYGHHGMQHLGIPMWLLSVMGLKLCITDVLGITLAELRSVMLADDFLTYHVSQLTWEMLHSYKYWMKRQVYWTKSTFWPNSYQTSFCCRYSMEI